MIQWIFSEREQGFEAKYAQDQEAMFRLHARRDHLFGLWVAAQLGYTPGAAEDYAAALVADDVHPAKPDAILMHPGPVIRGMELTSEVADGAQSCIHEQVRNGVKTRMAILAMLLGAAR